MSVFAASCSLGLQVVSCTTRFETEPMIFRKQRLFCKIYGVSLAEFGTTKVNGKLCADWNTKGAPPLYAYLTRNGLTSTVVTTVTVPLTGPPVTPRDVIVAAMDASGGVVVTDCSLKLERMPAD